ncbi:MAG TPA: PA14 domain-containing protein, partial [Ferruginibacter sp.]|nr:PA14 domain-containing protein [Ferruginibacter sp.]
MLQFLAGKYQRHISWMLFIIFYSEMITSASAMNINREYLPVNNYRNLDVKKKSIFFNTNDSISVFPENKSTDSKGRKITNHYFLSKIDNKYVTKIGPGQPEMESFKSVNSSNMVDQFTGDFSYNIPLMDVGGYPINIAYKSGISMDQEASWVGLGWNINPGTITRTLRGLPDDFDGVDSVTKTTTFKDNKTTGGTLGGDLEIDGFTLSFGSQAGFFYNTYKGWGAEYGVDASITAGSKGSGELTGGLSITNNTQDGLTIVPSLSAQSAELGSNSKGGVGGDFSIAAPYNTRTGMAGLQLSVGVKSYNNQKTDQNGDPDKSDVGHISGVISFCSPAFTPTISIPYTSSQFTFTGKLGLEYETVHPSIFASGYVSDQYIAEADMTSSRPAYGYLHYEDGAANTGSVLDFNTNKEIPYRTSPSVPNIGIPAYTYDAFSITGEGIGGMFRPYRSDLGYVFDHTMSTKDVSAGASVDLGTPALVHAGVDINYSHAITKSAPWTDDNLIGTNIAFQPSDTTFEAAYFRNPGEMAINTKAFYNSIGGDDVVAIDLSQSSSSSPTITASQILDRYRNKNLIAQLPVNNLLVKRQRDKRTQVISYLSAAEAENAGFSKYIENYGINQFGITSCSPIPNQSSNYGLMGEYFTDQNLSTFCKTEVDSIPSTTIPKNSNNTGCYTKSSIESIRWLGRIQATATSGKYTITTKSDDGVRVWINNLCIINDWK